MESTIIKINTKIEGIRKGKLISPKIEFNPNVNLCNNNVQKIFSLDSNELFLGDAILWLKKMPDSSVNLIFADPPYNIKKAEWDSFESQQQYVDWSIKWIREAARVLKENGSLYVCGFSEILADLKLPAQKYFRGCRWLVWHYKNKANLGKDWGRSHESILHFRKSKKFTLNIDDVRIPYGKHTLKYPEHPQAETSQYGKSRKVNKDLWMPNPGGAKPRDVLEIPVLSNGIEERTKHPTQKPEELLRKIILASSKVNDLVIDPFSGSGTTLVCAHQLNRRWNGCDNKKEYNFWAIKRLLNVKHQQIQKWKEFDKQTLLRRSSIR